MSRLCGRTTAPKGFCPCEYTIYEKIKEMPCLFGREDSPTPYGVFDIVKKSKVKEEYTAAIIKSMNG